MPLKELPDGPNGVESAEQILLRPVVPPAIETIEHHFRVIAAAGSRLAFYMTLGHELDLRVDLAIIGIDPESYRARH